MPFLKVLGLIAPVNHSNSAINFLISHCTFIYLMKTENQIPPVLSTSFFLVHVKFSGAKIKVDVFLVKNILTLSLNFGFCLFPGQIPATYLFLGNFT